MDTRPRPAPARRGLPCRAPAHRQRRRHAHPERRGTPSRRPTTARFTSGNTSHDGTLAGPPRLRGTRQRLRAPRTSLASPGPGLAQPPDHRDRSQQAINPYDRDIPTSYSVYVCILACPLNLRSGS